MRTLSIDYRKKRTDIAVTDPSQIVTNGLATASTSTLFDYLKNYIAHEEVERIVTGKPMQANDKPSENMAWMGRLVSRQRKAMPQIPIEYYDKHFTSVLVHKTMLANGIDKRARQNKALVDEMSAIIILQSYMESKRLR